MNKHSSSYSLWATPKISKIPGNPDFGNTLNEILRFSRSTWASGGPKSIVISRFEVAKHHLGANSGQELANLTPFYQFLLSFSGPRYSFSNVSGHMFPTCALPLCALFQQYGCRSGLEWYELVYASNTAAPREEDFGTSTWYSI